MDDTTQILRRVYRPKKCNKSEDQKREVFDKLVAVSGREVYGVISYKVLEDAILIQNLAVAPQYHKMGVATNLLRGVQEIAVARSIGRLTLKTIMQTGNPGIFEKMGFEVVQTEIAENFEGSTGSVVHVVSMNKRVQ